MNSVWYHIQHNTYDKLRDYLYVTTYMYMCTAPGESVCYTKITFSVQCKGKLPTVDEAHEENSNRNCIHTYYMHVHNDRYIIVSKGLYTFTSIYLQTTCIHFLSHNVLILLLICSVGAYTY